MVKINRLISREGDSKKIETANTLAQLHPANFTFVMASGVLALCFESTSWSVINQVLFWVTGISWVILFVLSGLRFCYSPQAVFDELLNPAMVFIYFTFVAATNLLGILLLPYIGGKLSILCWGMAFVVWSMLLYWAFGVLTFSNHEHRTNIIYGGWLIAIVATQTLVLLGIKIAPLLGSLQNAMLIEIHMLWGLGLVFYGIFITLFCQRIFFQKIEAKDISPVLWVVMGAAAICANAGIYLFVFQSDTSFLISQKPFLSGMSLMLWSFATWWIPLLWMLSVWKHGFNRVIFRYEAVLWSMVFPLGMYALTSRNFGLMMDSKPLQWIYLGMMWVAFVFWCFILVFFVRRWVEAQSVSRKNKMNDL